MNIEKYISSGILEAYALNELSSSEMKEVEEVLAKYPEVREELSAIELAFEDMAMATQIKPKTNLKASILEAVKEEKTEAPLQTVSEEKETHSEEKETKVIVMKTPVVWKVAVAASITLMIISSYLAILYKGKWENTNQAYAQLLASNNQMAEQYNQVNDKLNDLESDLEILGDPQFTRIAMPGTEQSPEAYASVYWNQTSEELYVNIRNLKQLATNQQYQLWAIIDGKPVDAGVFDWNSEGLVRMKNIAGTAVAAFAVTIEPEGGSESPSLETMQVLGNV